MKITDLAQKTLWEKMIREGYITAKSHMGATVYNYTAQAQYSKTWNDVTLNSRGLIVDDSTGEVIARPFHKFFNYGESGKRGKKATRFPMDAEVEVTDKLDGSMGILYTCPLTGESRISTRGSMTSSQAEHATEVYQARYEGNWEPEDGYTYLFEVIYPENRIVLNYGDTDDLMLIGKVNIETGVSTPLSQIDEWKWNRASVMGVRTLDEALALPPRPNSEGVVVHFLKSDKRVKVKQEDYIRLHRIAFGLNSIRIWEALKAGTDLEQWKQALEEEFYSFVDTVSERLISDYRKYEDQVKDAYDQIKQSIPSDHDQKTYALKVKEATSTPDTKWMLGPLFQIENRGFCNNVTDKIWDQVRPEMEKAVRSY